MEAFGFFQVAPESLNVNQCCLSLPVDIDSSQSNQARGKRQRFLTVTTMFLICCQGMKSTTKQALELLKIGLVWIQCDKYGTTFHPLVAATLCNIDIVLLIFAIMDKKQSSGIVFSAGC